MSAAPESDRPLAEHLDEAGLGRRTVLQASGLSVRVMDSVAQADARDRDQLIVTGSHGGASAGEYAARSGCRLVVCNDAGGGKHEAGTAGLRALEARGTLGIAVAHSSARIGDGHDAWNSGTISFVNGPAAAAGFALGARLADAIGDYLAGAPAGPAVDDAPPPPATAMMTRRLIADVRGTAVVAMDSISNCGPEDRGQVVVSASNGGRASGAVAAAFAPRLVVCNDAGFGKDDAGVAGLREIDALAVAGLAVSHLSAEISDGLDTWDAGVISFVNDSAVRAGFAVGERISAAVIEHLEHAQ